MPDRILYFLKRYVVPASVFRLLQPWYHRVLALLGALRYGFPGHGLVVIAVTGTNGKSTVVEMLHEVFTLAGYRTASLSTVRFKIGNDEIENRFKMTMPGRFFVSQFLRRARRQGVTHVVLEVTSEGIRQFRHAHIPFAAAVITNLTPEHIESHGGFENYKRTKGKLFQSLGKQGIAIVNLDDSHADYFLSFPAKEKIGYSLRNQESGIRNQRITKVIAPSSCVVRPDGIQMYFPEGWGVASPLRGRFNAENMMAAIATAEAFGISHETLRKVFALFRGVPGRMEEIPGKDFTVVVDYAFTPHALRSVYLSLRESGAERLLCVLGGTGGGRDKWKRPELGKIAGEYCAEVFITNEDPYDEDPRQIMEDVRRGVETKTNHFRIIEDRREAIRAACTTARAGDVVIVTGKGSESLMVLANGKKINFDDREVVREVLRGEHKR